MFGVVTNVFKYAFLQRAFLAGVFISICVALLGVNLVFKRCAMIGDGLSHIGFSTFAVSSALNWAPFLLSIPVVVGFAILLLMLNENSRVKSDSAIAILSNSSLSIGILVVSITTGMNVDVLNYMFGSILTLNNVDLLFSVVFSVIVIFMFIFLHNKIFAITFDEDFAVATGIKVRLYNVCVAVLTAVVVVVGIKMVGSLLISSLIIFPVLSASRLFRKYKTVVIFSALNSVFCFVVGFFCSLVYSIPTGATVVILNLTIFLIYSLVARLKNISYSGS